MGDLPLWLLVVLMQRASLQHGLRWGRVVQVQLLDRDHLLLALGSPDASASRLTESGHHRTWLVVYRISTAQILTLQDTFSRSLLQVSHPRLPFLSFWLLYKQAGDLCQGAVDKPTAYIPCGRGLLCFPSFSPTCTICRCMQLRLGIYLCSSPSILVCEA